MNIQALVKDLSIDFLGIKSYFEIYAVNDVEITLKIQLDNLGQRVALFLSIPKYIFELKERETIEEIQAYVAFGIKKELIKSFKYRGEAFE